MASVRVLSFAMSLDGYGAGTNQDVDHPVGINGPELFEWFFQTRVWRAMHGLEGGDTGIDNDVAAHAFENIGAWILGRNMFGPVRGAWPDDSWKGWWGEEPPYHVQTFILTHHARESITMKGGTVFHFVTDGIHAALERAKFAAGGRDVRIGGGPATVRQFLQAGLIDDVHIALRPVLLGTGESLLADLDMRALGYECDRTVSGERALHVFLRRREDARPRTLATLVAERVTAE
jgi:dihydrofolate reductase